MIKLENIKLMKIYDCFTFFNELDLLEIRLNILNPVVDYFVIVEASKTHSGSEKKLIFLNNKDQFKEFSEKIIHIIVDDMPSISNNDRWILENFQRNAISRGLTKCNADDLIMISDLDEIPNLEKIDSIKKILLKNSEKNDSIYKKFFEIKKYILNIKKKYWLISTVKKFVSLINIKSKKIVMFNQKLYYYFFNGFVHNYWSGTKIVLYKNLIKDFNNNPQQIRNSLGKTIINNGGWHFSYLFDAQGISQKIKSFAHSEFDKPEFTSINIIKERINKGDFLFGEKYHIKYVNIDSSYPRYILDNVERYKKYIN